MSQVEIVITEAQVELVVNTNNDVNLAMRSLEAVTKAIVSGTSYARSDYKLKGVDAEKKVIIIEVEDKPSTEKSKPKLEK